MLAQVFTPPALDSTSVTAKGGAVRLPGHWYALSFSCKLTPDYMKALSFSYELGKEIRAGIGSDIIYGILEGPVRLTGS